MSDHAYRLVLPIPKLEAELERELHARGLEFIGEDPIKEGRPVLLADTSAPIPLYWVQTDLGIFDCHPFESISDAVKLLKKIQKEKRARVSHFSFESHRRGELIASSFRPSKKANPPFPPLENAIPELHLLFSLLDAKNLLVSRTLHSEHYSGEWDFSEDKVNPPSRAYLKLWEAFGRLGRVPKSTEIAIDLGSCPGGWTWVLSAYAKNTISVDGASITPELLKNPRVRFIKKDAFLLKPEEFEPLDWICSDMICEPEKLLGLVKKWISVFPEASFICTLKFKGLSSFETIDAFAKIPNSRVLHQFHNKHELTWIRTIPR